MDYYHKLPNIGILKKLYLEDEMSTTEIAKKYNVTQRAVSTKLKRYNVRMRSLSEAQKLISFNIDLSKYAMNFLNGLLLGDGGLTLVNEKSVSYRHVDKNKSYIRWLKAKLEELGFKINHISQTETDYYRIQTRCYRNLKEYYNYWYPNGRKKIPDIKLSPITLLNWYVGDGSYRKGKNNTKKSEKVVICISFDVEGRNVMSEKLKELGIENSIYSDSIYIKAKGRERFFNFMFSGSEIPTCYMYKFPRRYLFGNE